MAQLRRVTSIDDLRDLARANVPRAFFEYADHGSYSQATLKANVRDLSSIPLRQRVLVNVDQRDLTTTILGERVSLPIALAPIGLSGMQWGDGEILACRAAHAAGIPYCLSTMSICSIEDVAEAVQKPFWFQLYVMRDRGFVRELMERAAAAGCNVLIPTLDLAVPAQRHSDTKNGLTVPLRITLSNVLDVATKPRWAVSIARGRKKTFGNLAGRVQGMEGVNTLAKWASAQFDPRLTWKDIEWIRDRWPGKMIVKGILDPEDARIAVKMGMQAMVVSNHGGRQLDGALSTAASLPNVAEAVKGDAEIIFDGGIRSGQDVLRALALGATACMIGRAYVYGLGAGGESGVAKAIEIIRNELDVTMALTGVTSIGAVGRHLIANHSEPT